MTELVKLQSQLITELVKLQSQLIKDGKVDLSQFVELHYTEGMNNMQIFKVGDVLHRSCWSDSPGLIDEISSINLSSEGNYLYSTSLRRTFSARDLFSAPKGVKVYGHIKTLSYKILKELDL